MYISMEHQSGTDFNYCVFRYGGRNYNGCSGYVNNTLRIYNSSFSLSNSLVKFTTYSGNCGGENGGAIWIMDNASVVTLTNVIVRDNAYRGIYSQGTLKMSGCKVFNSVYNGIECYGSNSVFNGNTIYNNKGYGILCQGNYASFNNNTIYNNTNNGLDYNQANGTFTGNTIYGNTGSYQAYITANTVSPFAQGNNHLQVINFRGGTISNNAIWTNSIVYACAGNLLLASGVSLVMQAGAVLKFAGAYNFEIDGTLVALGTQYQKIVFTSINNDSYGGDANFNGSATVPKPGDWTGLYFNGANSATALDWVMISYAGYNNAYALQLNNSNLSVKDMLIINNKYWGVYCASNSTITINHSDIYGNGYGLENLNSTNYANATGNWWGDITGPYNASTNTTGKGNQVSTLVNYGSWLNQSIDNPWSVFPSPDTTSYYHDVSQINFNNDMYVDLVGATDNNGLKMWKRTGYQTWKEMGEPVTTGNFTSVAVQDINGDGLQDIVARGSAGVTILSEKTQLLLHQTGLGTTCLLLKV